MRIGDRIKRVRGDMDKAEFARKLDIHRNTLPRYESGMRTPDADFLAKLCEQFDVNPSWLLTGEGHMRRKGVSPASPKEGKAPVRHEGAADLGDDYSLVPLYNVRGSAGPGAFADEEQVVDVLAFRTTWLRAELGVNPKDLSLVFVDGDSMEPTLHPGDVVLVNHAAKEKLSDGVWLLRLNDTLLIKRIQQYPGGIVKVKSDNEKSYESFDIDLKTSESGIEFIGRVVWAGRQF